MASRIAEVYRDGEWVEIVMKEVKVGDIIRLWEPDGTAVATDSGKSEFLALEDAFCVEEEDEEGEEVWAARMQAI